MNKFVASGLLALSLALPSGTLLADAGQRLRDFAKQTQTLSGQFTQVVFDRTGKKSQESGGELFFSRPGKFRWVYRKPYEQLIVGDGKKIWAYDSDLEQVTVRKLDRAIGESPAALLAGSNEIERYFLVRDAGERDGLDWLEATPKNKEGSFEAVRLGFKNGLLQAMELKDNFGQNTQLKFSGLKNNPVLKADLFRFTPPRGADVIGND